jgi:CHAT domain-containing protein
MYKISIYQKGLITLWLILSLSYTLPVSASKQAAVVNLQAITALEQGHFEKAIRLMEKLLKQRHWTSFQRVEIMIHLASAYQALGLSQKALAILSQAEHVIQPWYSQTFSSEKAIILAKLFLTKSDIFLAIREDVQARKQAEKSLRLLPSQPPALIHAAVLNNLGNVLTVEAYYAKAVKTYQRSVALARQADEPILIGRILINLAYAYFNNQQWLKTINTLLAGQQTFESLHSGYAKAFGLISLGELALKTLSEESMASSERLQTKHIAYEAFNSALQIAKNHDNPRLISYAYGFLGHLYETVERYTEAKRLTRQAIFYAKLDPVSFFTEQNQAQELLYRWQWQLGRLFKAENHIDEAILAYQEAVDSLQPIREELTTGYRNTSDSFRERVGPVYFELADLLLQRGARVYDTQKKAYLKQALETIEQFKTAELQDYFQDDCVISQSKQTFLEQGITPHTAVIYPILLSERTEILLSLPNRLEQFIIPITLNQIKDEVNEFRFELEDNKHDYFLAYAQRLYRLFIAPLESSLREVDTLIIVPDGVLRTIPFAALHDGDQYLISKYAIKTLPGLTLTPSQSHHSYNGKILLNGLSKAVEGYSALSNVPYELESIRQFYPPYHTTQLLDQAFTVERFADTLRQTNYSIVHIASHGQFDSDPQKTFLLTYDGKLTMNHLEVLIGLSERRQEALELLTLSACQTAVGDDQAALGLAGIALKAGAKSALASLWFIDDKATLYLMKQFYQQLQKNKLSKAKALQAAQQYLLQHYRYKHPAYWAPFLLISGHLEY